MFFAASIGAHGSPGNMKFQDLAFETGIPQDVERIMISIYLDPLICVSPIIRINKPEKDWCIPFNLKYPPNCLLTHNAIPHLTKIPSLHPHSRCVCAIRQVY